MDERWDYFFSTSMKNAKNTGSQELIIFGSDFNKTKKCESKEEFSDLRNAGVVSLRRNDSVFGSTRLFIYNSPIQFSHTHGDKGSFVLEADSRSILVDRGICNYGNANSNLMKSSVYHNLLVPEKNGIPCNQNTSEREKSGKLLESSFDGQIFRYSVDLTRIWDGIFVKNTRSFYSDSPDTFVIIDDAECENETVLSFRLNTYGEIKEQNGAFVIDCENIKLKVEPVNWRPEKCYAGIYGVDGNIKPVNQLAMFTVPVKKLKLETRLTLFKS